jgi:hypothetical protein
MTLEGTCRLLMNAPSCCESKRPVLPFAGAVGVRLAS